MKNIIIKICCIALCIVTVFCFTSCKKNTQNSLESTSIVKEQNPIADLITAIKKNPDEYNNKEVTVKGTIDKESSGTTLYDWNGTWGVMDRLNAKKEASIKVILSNTVQSSVVESGDYVEITGIVKITDEGIYLDNCKCTVLIAQEERK